MSVEKRDNAIKRFRTNGDLGVTAEDHKAIGSTPDVRLQENFGKTLSEIMTNSEIEEFVQSILDFLDEFYSKDIMIKLQRQQMTNLCTTLDYLKRVKRMPTKFTDLVL